MVETVKLSVSGVMREMPQVTVTPSELEWARYAGSLRYRDAVKQNRRRRDGTVATEEDDMLGATGEFMVSLAMRLPWRGPGTFRGDDVEGGLQVRTIADPTRRLIIQVMDNDMAPYILVRGTDNPLVWQLPGWILGKEGKQDIFWEAPAGLLHSYYVDQIFLHPMSELKVTSWWPPRS